MEHCSTTPSYALLTLKSLVVSNNISTSSSLQTRWVSPVLTFFFVGIVSVFTSLFLAGTFSSFFLTVFFELPPMKVFAPYFFLLLRQNDKQTYDPLQYSLKYVLLKVDKIQKKSSWRNLLLLKLQAWCLQLNEKYTLLNPYFSLDLKNLRTAISKKHVLVAASTIDCSWWT